MKSTTHIYGLIVFVIQLSLIQVLPAKDFQTWTAVFKAKSGYQVNLQCHSLESMTVKNLSEVSNKDYALTSFTAQNCIENYDPQKFTYRYIIHYSTKKTKFSRGGFSTSIKNALINAKKHYKNSSKDDEKTLDSITIIHERITNPKQ